MTIWASGSTYEAYVGRWSRLVARELLRWLAVPSGARWLDVGCGTGALSETILRGAGPAEVVGGDPSDGFIAYAREHVRGERVAFEVADAQALPFEAARFDVVVSGLVLNFVQAPERCLAEMIRVAGPSGTVAAYVWDYGGEMQLIRRFWDAAVALDPGARDLDEGRRFPLCRPEPLERLFREAGLERVAVRSIDVPTVFRDFDDYWAPFLGAQGPAPSYAMSLGEQQRAALRERIRAGLPATDDGSIRLIARAWAARGTTEPG
jgi:SAM-dependent methyltransferase